MGLKNLGKIVGDPGPRGRSFDPDEVGLLAGRSAYDGQAVGFSYLATDEAKIYWRKDGGGWSLGVPFGGQASSPTIFDVVLEADQEEVVVEWNEDMVALHGTRPPGMELYETTRDDGNNIVTVEKCTSEFYSDDGGETYRAFVGTGSSRTWEARVFFYTEEPYPDPPIPSTPPAPTNGIVDAEDYEFSFDQVEM
ncbi:MAG: hypothetical protein AAGB30_10945 [Pedobacter sp.]